MCNIKNINSDFSTVSILSVGSVKYGSVKNGEFLSELSITGNILSCNMMNLYSEDIFSFNVDLNDFESIKTYLMKFVLIYNNSSKNTKDFRFMDLTNTEIFNLSIEEIENYFVVFQMVNI